MRSLSGVPNQNPALYGLNAIFHDIVQGNMNSNAGRDLIRDEVSQSNPEQFPRYGEVGTDIYAVLRFLLEIQDNVICNYYQCRSCLFESEPEVEDQVLWHCSKDAWHKSPYKLGGYKSRSVTDWFNALLVSKTEVSCPQCKRPMNKHIQYCQEANFIAMEINNVKAKLEPEVSIPGCASKYRLCGLIYHGGYHFTCRCITLSGDVWYHDGVKTGDSYIFEGNLVNMELDKLRSAKRRQLSICVFTRLRS